MTLKELIYQHSQHKSLAEEASETVREEEKQAEAIVQEIEQTVDSAFAAYLSTLDLPDQEKPTKWYVKYYCNVSGQPLVRVGITRLGGKKLHEVLKLEDATAEFLPAANFGKEYPVEVRVETVRTCANYK